MVGAYKPVAEFIKVTRKVDFNVTFVNIPFVGSDALGQDLGDACENVIVSQVCRSRGTRRALLWRSMRPL